MSEDSITLEFNLAEPIAFKIGDYINDEIFGMFYLSEEATPPDYNVSTGAYKYSLRFDRDYILWGNKVFRLTRAGASTNFSDSITRGETTFTITDRLEVHIQEIIRNLWSLGYFTIGGDGCFYCTYGYCIDGTSLKVLRRVVAGEDVAFEFVDAPSWWHYSVPAFEGVKDREAMATITYDGANILTSLTDAICDPYKCEWWVLNNTLCLGKCEFGEKIDFRLDKDEDEDIINVETMRPQKNKSEFANRLYVFGSTKNLPDTYRKDLVFTVTDIVDAKYKDSKRVLLRKYLDDYFYKYTGDNPSVQVQQGGSTGDSVVINFDDCQLPYNGNMPFNAEYDINLNLVSNCGSAIVTFNYLFTLWINDMPVGQEMEGQVRSKGAGGELGIKLNHAKYLTDSTYYESGCHIQLKGKVWASGYNLMSGSANGTLSLEMANGYVIAPLACETLDGAPFKALYYENEYQQLDCFSPYDYSGIDFGVGFQYRILPTSDTNHGLNIIDVPHSWYSSLYGDINSNKILGERRLELPIGVDYIGDDLPREQVVEKVIVFEDIYPKCGLRICGLHAVEGTIDRETLQDNTIIQDTAVNYFIAVERITEDGDVPFPFNENGVDMRLPGEGLQIKFLTPDEAREYGPDNPAYNPSNMLSGLTFNLSINKSGSLITFIDDKTGRSMKGFQIERTEEYKTYLPNEVMKPTLGDTLVLSGWNPNYMLSLGLIDTAENDLKEAGEDYKKVLEYEQFTFDCSMMSDWASEMGVLPFGQKAWVFNKSLPIDTDEESPTHGLRVKASRVIGYELKLDIPEDTPVYTIGETDAYSRLKALESKLNAQERTGTSSGAISGSSSGGGGGSSANVEWGEEQATGTEVDLSVNHVTKRLLKTEALDFSEKKVGVQDDADFIMDINAMFPI